MNFSHILTIRHKHLLCLAKLQNQGSVTGSYQYLGQVCWLEWRVYWVSEMYKKTRHYTNWDTHLFHVSSQSMTSQNVHQYLNKTGKQMVGNPLLHAKARLAETGTASGILATRTLFSLCGQLGLCQIFCGQILLPFFQMFKLFSGQLWSPLWAFRYKEHLYWPTSILKIYRIWTQLMVIYQ